VVVEKDLAETEEHIDALEQCIQWCVYNGAIVSFAKGMVYVKVNRRGRTIMHGAPTFIDAVEQIATGVIP
jgi:hypothetical protein